MEGVLAVPSRVLQAGSPGRSTLLLQLVHTERPTVVWQEPGKQDPHFKYCFR